MFSKQITRKRLELRILLFVRKRLRRVESRSIKRARLTWRRKRKLRYQGLNVRGLCTEKLVIKGRNMEEKGDCCWDFIFVYFINYHVQLFLKKSIKNCQALICVNPYMVVIQGRKKVLFVMHGFLGLSQEWIFWNYSVLSAVQNKTKKKHLSPGYQVYLL